MHSSSSSASASPSDFGIPVLPDSPTSPFPPLLEASPESKEYSDDELSWEEIAAQRASGAAPRGEWEDEDEKKAKEEDISDLCLYFSATEIGHNPVKPEFVPLAAAPVEAAGEAMQFGEV